MVLAQNSSNPYDWMHEVTDPKLFAGRRDELSTIERELSRLLSSPYISPLIAVIGKRRVGKTSLLWKIKERCNSYPFLMVIFTVVNPIVVQDPWEFWRLTFDKIRQEAYTNGLLDTIDGQSKFGFNNEGTNSNFTHLYYENQQFDKVYGQHISSRISPVLDISIVIHDLQLLCECLSKHDYKGIILAIDETTSLLGAHEITQQLRQVSKTVKYGFIFAGESEASKLFTDPTEPLYLQGTIISVENFKENVDITECVLLPLKEEERKLISPIPW